MPETFRNVGDAAIIGNLNVTGVITGNMARSSLILENGAAFPILPSHWRIWDAYGTFLGTAAGDDLGLVSGTYGTQIPYIRTPDLNASGGPNNYRARFLFRTPESYDIGQTIQIRALAGMLTAVAGTSATIDFEVYQHTSDLGVGSDLVTTSAQNINSLTFSTFDFIINSAGISTGNALDVRVTITTTSATASSHFGCMSRCELLVPIRG